MAAKKKSAAKKNAAKKSAVTTSAAKKSPAKKTATKKTAAKKKTAGKSAGKKSGKKGLASKTFADAGAKVDKMLARGQKGIRGLQSKVVEMEEKSRAFLVDASSSPAIKKIRNLAKKATQARTGPRAGNGAAQRKSKSKSKGKAAKVVSNELSKLGDTLKDVFTPHAAPSDAN